MPRIGKSLIFRKIDTFVNRKFINKYHISDIHDNMSLEIIDRKYM